MENKGSLVVEEGEEQERKKERKKEEINRNFRVRFSLPQTRWMVIAAMNLLRLFKKSIQFRKLLQTVRGRTTVSSATASSSSKECRKVVSN